MDLSQSNKQKVEACSKGKGCPPQPGSLLKAKRVRSALLLVAIGVVLLVSGCAAVGPDFVRPTAEVNDEWLEADDELIQREPAEYTDWWTVFNDPTLDSLIATAFAQNLPLRTAGILLHPLQGESAETLALPRGCAELTLHPWSRETRR